jgi:hypothetical protein
VTQGHLNRAGFDADKRGHVPGGAFDLLGHGAVLIGNSHRIRVWDAGAQAEIAGRDTGCHISSNTPAATQADIIRFVEQLP